MKIKNAFEFAAIVSEQKRKLNLNESLTFLDSGGRKQRLLSVTTSGNGIKIEHGTQYKTPLTDDAGNYINVIDLHYADVIRADATKKGIKGSDNNKPFEIQFSVFKAPAKQPSATAGGVSLAEVFRVFGEPAKYYAELDEDDIYEDLYAIQEQLKMNGIRIGVETLKSYLFREIIRPYQRKHPS